MEILYNNNNKNKKQKSNVIVNVSKTSSNLFQCDYCSKVLSSRQSKWRHSKTCGKKSELEKRLEKVEKSNKLNIDLDSLIEIMNKNIKNIQIADTIMSMFYYDSKLNKILSELKGIITNNIESYQITSQSKNKFDDNIKKQIKSNLEIINKLESYIDYLKFQGKKQYLFRNNVKLLKLIENKVEQFVVEQSKHCLDSEPKYELLKYDEKTDELITVATTGNPIVHHKDQIVHSQDYDFSNLTDNSYQSSDSDFDI